MRIFIFILALLQGLFEHSKRVIIRELLEVVGDTFFNFLMMEKNSRKLDLK